jgi:hypothetical protein
MRGTLLIGSTALAASLLLTSVAAAGQAPATPEPLIPAGATALEGVPEVRVDATPERVERHQLEGAEAAAERLKVAIVDGQYFWTSRGNRPMTLSATGDFTYLSSSSEPGRYVRLRRVNDRIFYVEHVDMDPRSVTYWGELRIVLGK